MISLGDGLLNWVVPVPMRDKFWMSIRSLYDAHEQTVELIAERVGGGVR